MNRSYAEQKTGCSIINLFGEWALIDKLGVVIKLSRVKRARDAFKELHDWFYRQIQQKALFRAGNKCERCGSTYMLGCHHKQHRSQGGAHSLENIDVLCQECHAQEH